MTPFVDLITAFKCLHEDDDDIDDGDAKSFKKYIYSSSLLRKQVS